MLRRVPIDALALVAIALGISVTHLHYIAHGMCWNDPSWYFHFGHRTLAGDVPYRDYVFQVGPLPIYIDAAFQYVFGSVYVASLYAALAIKIVRVWVMWMLGRRLAGARAAALLVVFCALDSTFSFSHHWSTPYAALFITTSALFFVLAARAAGRSELVYLALAGASAASVATARQSSAIVIALVAMVATTVLWARKEYFTRKRFLAFWIGFASVVFVVCTLLALARALGPAIQQMFLDAPQKKNIHGVTAVLDALSGGALVEPGHSWWGGFLVFLAVPVALIAGALYLGAREAAVSSRTLATLVFPVALVFGLATRWSLFFSFSDLPRTLLSVTTLLAIAFPARLRTWFGLEPVMAIALGALPLASDWALEMSFPGRGWGDSWSLVAGGILVTLASVHLSVRVKTAICGALGIMGIVSMMVFVHARFDPFAASDSQDGTLRESKLRSSHPMLRGLRVAAWRTHGLDELISIVPPNHTCFVYGNMPVLYDLLACTNPTRIDSTAADFITGGDALGAIAALRAHPPDFIIASDRQWMNPPISEVRGERLESYGDSLNPKASMEMHEGLRALIDGYEDLGTLGSRLGPELAQQADAQRDYIASIHLYRRRP